MTDRRASTSLVMIVPLGLDPYIYPWGPRLLVEYAQGTECGRSCRLWDLRREEKLLDLATNAQPLLEHLFLAATSAERTLFMGHTQNPLLLYEAAASMGSGALRGRPAPLGVSEALDHLSSEHERTFERLATPFRKLGERRLYALSVYDYTALGCLHVAAQLKRLDPGCTIVLGGDYIDRPIAERLVRDLAFVDAVVIGYGEEALSVLLAHLDRSPISSFVAEGVVTHAAFSGGVEGAPAPAHYTRIDEPQPVSYAAVADGTIRMLTQRGCSWGECTFCSQIDRRRFYAVRMNEILDAIPALLTSASLKGDTVRVSLDSDENDLARVLPVAEEIAAHLEAGQNARIEFWLMVRSFRADLCEAALRLKKRVRFRVRLNIESLSLQRLRDMKKGFSPLQALEATKALLDCGQEVASNYFSFYPGRDCDEDALQEAELLRAASHLVLDPAMSLAAFPYAMNGRDTVAEDPGHYGMELRRLDGDDWLFRATGVDLPYSIWAYELSAGPDCSPATRSEISWSVLRKRMIASRGGLSRLRGAALSLAETRQTFGEELQRFEEAARSLSDMFSDSLHAGRAARIATMNAIESVRASRRLDVTGAAQHLGYAERVIRGDTLQQRRVGEDRVSTEPLSPAELALLRYLYWVRKTSEVQARFPDLSVRLQAFLDRGLVVEQRGHCLSLVRDPEFWLLPQSEREVPSRLTQTTSSTPHARPGDTLGTAA